MCVFACFSGRSYWNDLANASNCQSQLPFCPNMWIVPTPSNLIHIWWGPIIVCAHEHVWPSNISSPKQTSMMCPSHYMHSTHIVGVLPWNPPFNSSGDELASTFCPFSRNHCSVVRTTAYSLTHQKIEQVTERWDRMSLWWLQQVWIKYWTNVETESETGCVLSMQNS